jgi:hypothetical protein
MKFTFFIFSKEIQISNGRVRVEIRVRAMAKNKEA